MRDACIIIPARYSSSRFPGKPLVNLLGKPMILWVLELCCKAFSKEDVYVATDDNRIDSFVSKLGYKVILTSSDCITGTDRVAEAAQNLNYKYIVNVQGDEPLLNPRDIIRCVELKKRYPNSVVNAFARVGETEVPSSKNIPIVVFNEKSDLLYITRGVIPCTKEPSNKTPIKFYKQVCIYAYTKEELREYYNFGRKSELELIEDIEILRFFELDKNVKMLEVESGSIAIDCPQDVAKFESLFL